MMRKTTVILGCVAVCVVPGVSAAQQARSSGGTDDAKKEWVIPYEYKRVIFGDTVTAHEQPAAAQPAQEEVSGQPEPAVGRPVNPEAVEAAAVRAQKARENQTREAPVETAMPALPMPESTVWDFGTVNQGDVLQYEFIIENRSRVRPLNILSVNSSCGCTVSQVKKKILEPGESTTLTVQFKTKGYAGPVKQFVYVHTDDPDENLRRFVVKANVTTRSQ